MKSFAAFIYTVFFALNGFAQVDLKPCGSHGIGLPIKDSLLEPVAIFKLLRCQDSSLIKGAKAIITLQSGKIVTKKLNKNGEFVFDVSAFLQVKKLELKRKEYQSIIYSENAIEQKQARLKEGVSMRYFYFTDLISNHKIECTWE